MHFGWFHFLLHISTLAFSNTVMCPGVICPLHHLKDAWSSHIKHSISGFESLVSFLIFANTLGLTELFLSSPWAFSLKITFPSYFCCCNILLVSLVGLKQDGKYIVCNCHIEHPLNVLPCFTGGYSEGRSQVTYL